MDTNDTPTGQIEVATDEGYTATWNGHAFAGDQVVTSAARQAITEAHVVDVFGAFPIPAAADNAFGVMAALFAHYPRRTYITAAPEQVTDWLDTAFAARQFQAGQEAESIPASPHTTKA